MSQFPRSILKPAAVLIAINVIGLLWIHHDLTAIRPATVLARDVALAPDDIRADRLQIVFDRPVVAPESAGQPAKEGLFVLEPHWEGSWRWVSPDTLEYLFDAPLPPGRRFKLTATDRFGKLTGMTLDGETSFEILTQALALKDSKVIAADPDWVTVELGFNQAVAPADLLRHIEFGDATDGDGHPFEDVQCLTQGVEERMVLRVRRPASDRLRVRLDEHLTGVNADLSLSHTTVWEMVIEKGFAYLSNYVWVPEFADTATVRLVFSDTLNREQVLPEIKTTPAVEDLNVHRSGRELVLTGKFKPEQRYTIHVPADLTSQEKKTLGQDCSVPVSFAARQPGLSFTNGGGILSPAGRLTLDMKAVNVSDADFHVWRVHENNLVSHLRGEERYATSRSMPQKTVKFSTVRNEIHDFALSITDLIESKTGVYYIMAESVSPRWASAGTLVTVTDLAITAKTEEDGCLVWVTSLRKGLPVENAVVKAVSYNNQVLTQGTTDPNGIAHLPYPDSRPDGAMWAILAQKGDDLSYLRPGDNQWMIDEIDQSGRSYPADVEAMLYAERGAYRPGDTVHLTGIVRQRDGGIPPAFPFRIEVIRPDGRTFAELTAAPPKDSQGIFHADVPTRADGQTGPYRFYATLPGDDMVLGSTIAFVEAFLPQRMKVSAEPSATRYDPNETPEIRVSGRYLWDQPAADVQVKAEATLLPSRFTSPKWEGFVFGMPIRRGAVSVKTVEGRLDDEGKGVLQISIPADIEPAFYVMQATTTVTEPGARSVSANSSVVVDRLNHHLGLRFASEALPSPGNPVMVEWVSLTGADEPRTPGELQRKLEAVEYESVVKEQDGRRVWHSVERLIEVSKKTLVAAGDAEGSFEIVCPDAGQYRLTITDAASGSRTQLDMTAWAGGERQNLSMEDPERLEIVTDKKAYRPGETAKVLIRSPIPGTVLAAIESDRVAAWRIAEVVNNTAELEFDLAEELRGSVFVTATVVRAVDPNAENWLPHRAMGMTRLVLDHGANRLPVEIHAAEKGRPGEVLAVTVETAPPADPNCPAMVHLWAVDEGLLLPTGYETPDVHGYFLSPRRSAVFTSDLFYQLLPDYDRPDTIARIGADGEFDMGRLRRNPVETAGRVPDVVWREAAAVGADGKVTVEVKVPELIGQMRLMAVAVDHDRYGRGQRPVTLTSDLIVESNWPRFAAPGDTFEVPVKLFNSTDKAMRVAVEAVVDGHIHIEQPTADAIEIPPGKAATHILKVRAVEIGPVEVRITGRQVDAGEAAASFTDKRALSVRPAAALHGEVALKSIEAGETLRVEPSASFVPGTEQLTISVSGRPTVQLGPALEKLIHYPYGCVEQTASRLFALLYAAPILGEGHAERIHGMVQAGIVRLWSMQTTPGGLSYWPGGDSPTPWGSAYAGWCLLECKNAGFSVDPRFSEELMAYLESELQSTTHGKDFQGTRALLCHILSAFGKPPYGWMGRLAEQKDDLDLEALAHLAGAFHEAGDREAALRLLPAEMIDVTVATSTSERLTSRLQQYAVWLGVLLEIDPDHEMVGGLVNLITDARRDGCWGNTLENAAAVVALSRYQVLNAAKEEPEFSGAITLVGGETVAFDHTATRVHTVRDFSEPLTVSSQGRGRIYIAMSSEGLARKGVIEPYDRRLSVRRRWLDRTGTAVDPNSIRVGDLVQVEIELATNEPERIDNIAIVDALAGGMEVENPRLATSAGSAQDGGAAADHVELLDDRVVLFAGARKGTQVFKYALRVTTAGIFELPAVQASCMYDPSIASLGAPATVRIMP